ncbi:MAG UNVERIFIED_CONTAM: ATP-dependent helicase [Anaerolineae bacterium]|jgi:DNA helicase-2/ATP-dependent DNA helicase PcrA
MKKNLDDYKRLIQFLHLYKHYQSMLTTGTVRLTDFSLLQREALQLLQVHPTSEQIFKHVIIDEYQDTNTIQEKIFFKLAKGFGNICVVGDDDQALYRFRGATVENFCTVPERCYSNLGKRPTVIPLTINYRSRSQIVEFYNQFMSQHAWHDGKTRYRVDKTIDAARQDNDIAVVATKKDDAENCFDEIAQLARQLLDEKKVQDPNQIAFLFPSLKSEQVERATRALEKVGLKVYAPRAKRFLETEEAIDIFSIYLSIFGRPIKDNFPALTTEISIIGWTNLKSVRKNFLKLTLY